MIARLVLLLMFVAPVLWAQGEALNTLPMGKGLPVVVRVGLYFADIDSIDEVSGTFSATIDVRLRWQDLRLAYPDAEAPGGFKEFKGAAAEKKLGEIWLPDVGIENISGEPSYQARGLRLYPTGQVELMQRTSAKFAVTFDVGSFPFDRQRLEVKVASRRDNADFVSLDFRQADLDFSKVAPSVTLDGWTPMLVDIRREFMPGWNGEKHARLMIALSVARQPASSIAAVFIPLLATLLIPLLSIWMNRVDKAEFQIEAFELANVIIGGLFAIIALNFTINAAYPTLAAGDNTVTRLFGLNYIALAVSLAINVLMIRFNFVARLFGKYVQEQLFLFQLWAVPVLTLATAAALLLAARA